MELHTQHSDPLALHLPHVRKILVDFLRDEIQTAGFSKAVIGLSGGIDSAVSAFLAAEALGKENVHCVMMPYTSSSPESLSDARTIVEHLQCGSTVVEIAPMVDPLFSHLSIDDKLRRGNIMARERMIVLYDFSQKQKALVVGTSNKTESLLGYGTLFGDMACAINPLGDLYKTQVWALGKELGVPDKIIAKKPSADLWEGQSDEEELGFSYAEADRLLYFMVDERVSENELLKKGFDRHFVDNVRSKVQKNQFKRRPPIIAKISHRTVNVDFRYPRDWGM